VKCYHTVAESRQLGRHPITVAADFALSREIFESVMNRQADLVGVGRLLAICAANGRGSEILSTMAAGAGEYEIAEFPVTVPVMDNSQEALTKQDLAILRSEMNHQFDDLKETFRDSQTELLKAFYAFTESNRQRVNQFEGN
jgi:hypothetical protein